MPTTPTPTFFPPAPVTPSEPADSPPGFDLLDRIGHGGMGTVYRAWDCRLNRAVAVKVLQHRFPAGSPAVARFEKEARITSQLQHPGIPPVYQVGELPDGRPFLAMRLILGRTLDELLKHGASLDRLGVFQAVAQAVGYAHAQGVIHRDLKPANVMVGAFGEVQVVDWGLAKVLADGIEPPRGYDPEATTADPEEPRPDPADSPWTQYGWAIGTPAYMAPEQAAGELDKVGRRSDVFGLGAVLCVLLTGRPPFSGRTGEEVRLNAVRGRTEDAFARLDGCGAEPDVVALCKQCLAARPADLRQAADARAHRAEVDRGTAEVRAAEHARRSRIVAVAEGVVAAVLLLGVVGTTAGLVHARAERDRARAAQRHADDQADIARAVRDFLQDSLLGQANVTHQANAVVKTGRPADSVTPNPTIRELLDRAAAELGPDDGDGHFAGKPLVRAELLETIGNTYRGIGDIATGVRHLERACALRERFGPPGDPRTLKAVGWLGLASVQAGRPQEAARCFERAIAGLKGAPDTEDLAVVKFESGLAWAYRDLGRPADSAAILEGLRERLLRSRGADDPDLLKTEAELAWTYKDLGRVAEAITLDERVFRAKEAGQGRDHPTTLTTMHHLSWLYALAGRHPEALALNRRAHEARVRVHGPEHPETMWTLHTLAELHLLAGQPPAALPPAEQAWRVRHKRLGVTHPLTLSSLAVFAQAGRACGKSDQVQGALAETAAALTELVRKHAAAGEQESAAEYRRKLDALGLTDSVE